MKQNKSTTPTPPETTTAKHTAIPWRMAYRPDRTGFTHCIYDAREAAGEPDPAGHLAEVFGQSVFENDHNARFICLAVNHHDELVEALREALKYSEFRGTDEEFLNLDWNALSKQARAVLAKIDREKGA